MKKVIKSSIRKIKKTIKPMKKQVWCLHNKDCCYSYDIVNAELNLCEKCESKLRREIFEQDKAEKEIHEYLKKRGWMPTKEGLKYGDTIIKYLNTDGRNKLRTTRDRR
jgi:hypothetical protein